MEGIEAEEFVQDIDGDGVELIAESLALESIVEILDDEVLGVSGGEAPKVNEERVPGVLLCVSVLESLEGQE
jgi:hypothetical protein